MTQKYVMGSPLYRMEMDFDRSGYPLSRQTMSNWMIHCSETWLSPLYEELHRRLLQEPIIHADETELQVLHEPGKKAQTKSYMWLYRSGKYAEHPIILYEYQPGRGGSCPINFLQGFHGYLQTDGYGGYDRVEDVVHVGCMAHLKRKFHDAVTALPNGKKTGTAVEGEAYCVRLFELEKAFADLTPEERKQKRQELAKPVLDEFFAWASTRRAAQKSKLGIALTYLNNNRQELSEYLSRRVVSRSPFLKYKNIVSDKEGREWYEPSQKEKLDKFFESVDWESVSSNVEKLPWFARMLKENTPKLKVKPAADEKLFAFARKKGWKDRLDPTVMEFTSSLIDDYENALRRIRVSRLGGVDMRRRRDIERILFMRGQENAYTADELYGVLQDLSAEHVARIRWNLTALKWQLMQRSERERFLLGVIPYAMQADYMDVFANFRKGGYRVLGDIICDMDDRYRREEMKKGAIHRTTDSVLMERIMSGYEKSTNWDYQDLAASRVREYLNRSGIRPDEALKCAVALGKRGFVFDVLLDRVEANAIKVKRR